MAQLNCQVLTPEGTIFDGNVDSLVAPASDGQLGVLPRHAPLITALGHGKLQLKTGGSTQTFVLEGGFMEVLDDHVAILADKAKAH